MPYILYGARGSGSSIVELACAEVGIAYEVRDLDMRGQEQRGEAYAAVNPQRKIPALDLGNGEVMTESAAILLTLDERHRDGGLLPPLGSPQRAQALRWLLFCATELYPIIEIVDYPDRFSGSPQGSDLTRRRALEIWRERWQVVEHNVAGAPFVVDTGFSATDLYLAVLSRWDLEADWRRANLPRVEAIVEAVRTRPSLAAVWARHFGD